MYGCQQSNLTTVAKAPPIHGENPLARAAVNAACAEIYRHWRRFVPEDQARAEVKRFRGRFKALAVDGYLTEAELDGTLEIIADCMGVDA